MHKNRSSLVVLSFVRGGDRHAHMDVQYDIICNDEVLRYAVNASLVVEVDPRALYEIVPTINHMVGTCFG